MHEHGLETEKEYVLKQRAALIAHDPKQKLRQVGLKDAGALLYCPTVTPHLKSTIPMNRSKTYLKPLRSVREVQDCLERI